MNVTNPSRSPIRVFGALLVFAVLACVLWTLRSWNLEIGDGEFCCKQTIGDAIFPITVSRSFLSYLLYRQMFYYLHPVLGWWIEDIIALSSVTAGLLFFGALYRLACLAGRDAWEKAAIVLLPSTTLMLQIFCGHIEFYPWTNALLMTSALCCWLCLQNRLPIWVPSAVMVLAAAFHSSGVFYYPALLLLPILRNQTDGEVGISRQYLKNYAGFVTLFVGMAILHRKWWLYLLVVVLAVPLFFYLIPWKRRQELWPWLSVLLPWFFLFTLRASLGLYSEPLLEHLPPLREPYDHGAFLYMAFSWDHLYDKTMFHFWLAPFGLPLLLIFGIGCWKQVAQNRWLLFLTHFCLWALAWTILFYPQLRTRDWDLFATMSIPLNLAAVFFVLHCTAKPLTRWVLPVMVAIQVYIAFPIVWENSQIGEGRGYVQVEVAPKPVEANAYIRGLPLGLTPLTHANIRSGDAVVRVIPTNKQYHSWAALETLEPGELYTFQPELKKRELVP